jgi:hypothetical protein
MTSSATPTDADDRGEADDPPAAPPSPPLAARLRAWPAAHPDWVAIAALLAAGWVLIGHVNGWHLGVPVLVLAIGWLAILLGGRFLWRSADAAAREGEVGGDERFEGRSPREELEAEKRAVLKAIKEVEFDRDMGKMSESDAAEIVRFYRVRAIAILKELEDPEGRPLSAEEQVERELRARLEIAKVAAAGKAKARAEPRNKPAPMPKPEPGPKTKAETKPAAAAASEAAEASSTSTSTSTSTPTGAETGSEAGGEAGAGKDAS